MDLQFSFKAKLWLRNNGTAAASWHFITVPKKISHTLREAKVGASKHGLGEITTEFRVGPVKWQGVLFWSKAVEAYIFPIKASLRKQLHIIDDDEILIDLSVLYSKKKSRE